MKRKYVKAKGENFIFAMMCFFIIGFVLTRFIGQAMLQSENSELQRLKSKIETQEKLQVFK